MSAFCAAEQLVNAIPIGTAGLAVGFPSTLSALMVGSGDVIVLQPNPVFVVHVNADVAAPHDGIDWAAGTATPDVALPRTVLDPMPGRSARSRARNVGVPDEPFGDPKNRLAVCDAKVPIRVPVVVTGDPETVKIFGSANPTDVTVPVPAAGCHDGTPEEFSVRTCVPLLLPARPVHPDGPRYASDPGVAPNRKSKNALPETPRGGACDPVGFAHVWPAEN